MYEFHGGALPGSGADRPRPPELKPRFGFRNSISTALGSDGQGPKGFSFIFLDLFDFFDLFADLARACLGFLERPSTLVRGRASTYGLHNRTAEDLPH